jgi:UDP-N-acetylmuramoylalanine--D-glutamate ligase
MTKSAIPASWEASLGPELSKPYFTELMKFLAEERASKQIFPPENEVFSALELTPYENVNVLLLGQDPYHDDGQAHGLCFSVKPGIKAPPSLANMYKELKTDVGCKIPNNGYLVPWAKQGVLMINAVLTVQAHTPNSHKDRGWEQFTDAIIRKVNERPHVVFLLWGAYAQKKVKLIDAKKHTILKCAHPSPLSATKFFGSKPFSQTNAALKAHGQPEIDWQIPDLLAPSPARSSTRGAGRGGRAGSISLFMELAGKTVVVVGLGRSGVAAARVCLQRGARVLCNDAAPRERLSAAALALETAGATLVPGGHDRLDWSQAELVVVSPGVPPFAERHKVEARGVPVLGELDLAWQLFQPALPTAAIGGTNGKSTTTSLVGAMMEAAGRRAFVGGNLGVPLAEVVPAPGSISPLDTLVLEVSSYQSEKMPTLKPRAAAILNVTPDHLDRYESFDDYADAKGNLLVRMDTGDTVVIPSQDPICERQARRARPGARIVTFGPHGDIRIEREYIIDTIHGDRYDRSAMFLRGEHNMLNVAAAIALARGMGLDHPAITLALRTFQGLDHRIAFVAELGGVRYYDDSKGTNVGASVAALRGLAEPRAVLIAGGRDKLGDYEPLIEALRERGRALVVMGEAAERIAAAARGVLPVVAVGSMEEAVEASRALAQPGDAVLLSPACSSFDMFRDYKDRGDRFVQAVKMLLP